MLHNFAGSNLSILDIPYRKLLSLFFIDVPAYSGYSITINKQEGPS